MPIVNIRQHGHAHARRAHARARGCAQRCPRRGAGGHRGHPHVAMRVQDPFVEEPVDMSLRNILPI